MESEKSIKEIVDDIQKLEKPVEKIQASDFCLYDFIDRLTCGFAEVDLYTCDDHSDNSYICTFNLSNCEHILKIYGPCSVYEWNFKPQADCALTVSIVNDVSDVLHKGTTKEDWDMRAKLVTRSKIDTMKYVNADDIKPDDEWMQENEWDDIYLGDGVYERVRKGDVRSTQQEELGTVHVSDGERKGEIV